MTIKEGLTDRQVEEFIFAEEGVLTLDDIRALMVTGTDSDDQLVGFNDRDDRLDGKAGSDALEGAGGDDVYVFDAGYGADSVRDTGGIDRIEFGEGVSFASVEFSDEDGDLLITLKDSNDSLIIFGGLSSSSRRREEFAFQDGTVVTYETVVRGLIERSPTPGNDVIDADTDIAVEIRGGTGDDLIHGGSDTTFFFRSGDGVDFIDTVGESGESRLVLEDFTPDQAVIRRPDLDSLDIIIAFPESGDQVLVRGALGNTNLTTVAFANGVEWSKLELISQSIVSQQSDRADTLIGSIEDDTIETGAGDDDILAGQGDDTIFFRRGDGRDVVDGGTGTDRLEIREYEPGEVTVSRPVSDRDELLLSFGDSDDEILIRSGVEIVAFGDGTEWTLAQLQEAAVGRGTPFADTINGSDTANTIVGAAGDDLLIGNDGSDIYLYARGDGRDIINDQGSASDLNELRISDYALADAEIIRYADRPEDLTLRFSDADEIIIVGGFVENGSHMAKLTFEDGAEVSAADIVALLEAEIVDGDQVIDGTSASETLAGGLGDDLLRGEDGSDRYMFNEGDGHDIIDDNGRYDTDVLEIRGYNSTDASFSTDPADVNTLIITFAGSDDRITVINTLNSSTADQIETIEFADDSTTYSINTIRETFILAPQATDGDDIIIGYADGNTITGNAGNDILRGGDGSERYIFEKGDGQDIIDDNGNNDSDVVEVRGHSLADTRFSTDPANANTLILTFEGSDDRLTIRDALDGSADDQIETIEFTEDGVTHTINTIRETFILKPQATDGDDVINGYRDGNTITGGKGNDILRGGNGSERYIFNEGDGHDIIDDSGFGDSDIIEIRGHSSADARYSIDPANADTLIITFEGSDDRITVRNTLNGSTEDEIETIEFDEDGVSYSINTIRETFVLAEQATDGDDVVNGYRDGNNIAGGKGNDVLRGGNGSDRYVFNKDDGHDIIDDNGLGDTDYVEINGYTADQVISSRSPVRSDTLEITFVNSDDRITVYNTLDGNFNDEIEQVRIDGQTISMDDILAGIIADEQSNSDDVIEGSSADETLQGGKGNDILRGNDGSDIYVFQRYDGIDTIEDNGEDDTDVLKIEQYNAADATFTRDLYPFETLEITFAGTDDRISIINTLGGSFSDTIEEIHFDDAVLLIDDIIAGLPDIEYVQVGDGEGEGEGPGNFEFDRDAYTAAEDSYVFSQPFVFYTYQRSVGDVYLDPVADFDPQTETVTTTPVQVLLSDINFSDATPERFGEDLVLQIAESSVGANDGATMVAVAFFAQGLGDTVGEFAFADLQTLSADDIRDMFPDEVNEVEPGAGDQFITGSFVADTYVYNRGDGDDVIEDFTEIQGGPPIVDTLKLKGISTLDATLEIVDQDLIINIAPSAVDAGDAGSITLLGSVSDENDHGIERIEFDDGTVWEKSSFATIAGQIISTSGDDIITGTSASEIIAGGLGDDVIFGGDGSDTYVFRKGDGRDHINDNGFHDTDKLRIEGYSSAEANFAIDPFLSSSLIITFTGTDDQITLYNSLNGSNSDQIEQVEFAGDTTFTIAEIRASVIAAQATDGDDVVTGFDTSDDTLTGGRGNDVLKGGEGSDIYEFTAGDGQDIIDDNGFSATDVLRIDGYTAAQASFSIDPVFSASLIITFAGSDDQITLYNTLNASTNDQIERVEFVGDTTLTIAEIRASVIAARATDGDDVISGYDRINDTLAGGRGNDVLKGKDGSDNYEFTAGDGQDIIDDNGNGDTDVLKIEGYTSAQASFAIDPVVSTSLIITFAGSDDQITLYNSLNGSADDQIEQIEFVGDTTLSIAEVRALAIAAQTTDGDDTVIGYSGSDNLLAGGKGSDVLRGRDGSDTYEFNIGDGHDIIDDNGNGDTDELLIKGYNRSDAVFSIDRANANTLIITFEGSDDKITLINTLNASSADQIEQIVFDDVTITAAEYQQQIIDGLQTDGDDIISGYSSDGSHAGGRGNDILSGFAGDDTYVYTRGDGNDVIIDSSGSADVLNLFGIHPDNVIVRRGVGDDLELVILETAPDAGDGGRIVVRDSFLPTGSQGIETVIFDNGTTWTRAESETFAVRNVATDGDDSLTGTAADETFEAGRGNDFTSGLGGDDTYRFNKGDGLDLIRDAGDGTDTVEIIGYSAAEAVFTKRGTDGVDLIIRLGTEGDTITIINGLADGTADRIENIRFVDTDETLSLAQVQARLVLGDASLGDDVIIGTDLADNLSGGQGNDLLLGGEGDDTYIYNSGDGDDRIVDTGSSDGDTLVLSDIASTDLVNARRSPANSADLVLQFEGRNRIFVIDALDTDATGIDRIEFSDGVSWEYAQMRSAVLDFASTALNETIIGFESDDILAGEGGNDVLIGGLGADIYQFSSGDGHETIDDQSTSAGDRLEFTGLLSSEATLRRLFKGSETVVIEFDNGQDSVTVRDLLSDTGAGIEEIAFSDGVTWTSAEVLDRLDNNKPTATEDGIFTVKREEPLMIDSTRLLANDFDPDGDPLSILSVDGGENGNAEIDAGGNIVFTGAEGFTGVTQFTYTISDGRNGLATGVVSVRVTPPASAKDDFGFTVNEDEFLTIESLRLLSNDADDDRLLVSQVINPQNGEVSLASNGDISFTPTENFNGLASFTYVANTPEGGRTEAVVYIDVLAVNDQPEASNDSGYSVDEGGVLSFNASELLTNDSDLDGDALVVTSVSGNADLQVELTDDGVVVVTPTAFYFGDATFEYTIADPDGLESTATVSVTVDPVNDPPEPQDDNLTGLEDREIIITQAELLANDIERDGDPLSVVSVRGGLGGSVELLANGTIHFDPTSNFFGQAHFFYKVDDGQGGLVEARVNIQLDPDNDAPLGLDDGPITGTEDVVLYIDVADLLANDTDVDSVSLDITSITEDENGTAELLDDGRIRFAPDADYWGEASFHYVVQDDEGAVGSAKVSLYFDPVGDAPPVAVNDHLTIDEDEVTVITADFILFNDTDIDRDVLELVDARIALGFDGSLEINEDGDLVLTPKLNSISGTRITYTVTDNADGQDTGTIFVSYNPVNDAPTANPDAGLTSLDAPLILRISDLLANDTDVDGDPIEFAQIDSASDGGVFSVYNDEFVVVEYARGFSGQTSLQYTITDPDNLPNSTTIAGLITDTHLATLSGSAIRDLIIGTHLGERIEGLEGNDDLFGREGDDLLIGGAGADKLDGGEGFDTVDFVGSNVGVRADLQSRIGQGGDAQGDLYTSIEALAGTEIGDDLYGNSEDNTLTGRGGNDLLVGRDGDDRLEGGIGNDTFIGGEGADQLIGGEGSDTADYSDLTSGVASPAAVNVSLANGTATGGDAEGDTFDSIENLIGTEFGDTLEGDDGANVISGGRGDDLIIGGAGNDILEGGRGADDIRGGEGIDQATYAGSAEAVTINLQDTSAGGGDAQGDVFSSIELIIGSFHDDTILGDANDNRFMGGRGADQIDGGEGFDIADYSEADEAVAIDLATGEGSAGEADGDQLSNIEKIVASVHDDILFGSSAGDTFFGGLGDDQLAGRGGSDVYEFGVGDGSDTITENGAESDIDRLVLGSEIQVVDVSVLREGDDLLLEFEQNGGILTDTVRVDDHFLGRETGIEEIEFGNGVVWDRNQIDQVIRAGRFNAQDDIIRFVDEDVAHVITPDLLIANDADEDLEFLDIIRVENFENGTAILREDDTIEFLGDQDFNGDAFFDYVVEDQHGRQSRARVEVNVLPVNDAPVAANDGPFVGLEDTVLQIPLEDILGNDFDVDGDDLRIVDFLPLLDENGDPFFPSTTGDGSHGRATLGNGVVNFSPDSNYFGFAGFRYTITDDNGEFSTAEVELQILAVNDGPSTGRDGATVRLGRTEYISIENLLADDVDPEGDAISFVNADTPVNGTIELVDALLQPVADPADAVFVKFDADALGDASFKYYNQDSFGVGGSGTVNITVRPLNDPPNARRDDGFETIEDQVIIIDPADLLANDTDPDGDPLTILELERFPLNGSVEFNGDGMIVFTPRSDYNGKAGFVYTVTDGKDLDTDYPGTDTAFVEINIVPDNDAPQLRDDIVNGFEDLPITVIPAEAFANDLDFEGDVLFFEDAQFLGVLTNDFSNRTETTLGSDLTNPVVDAANTTVAASLTEGGDLPDWLSFDEASLTFTGTVPDPAPDAFEVELTFTYTDPDTAEVYEYTDTLAIDPSNAQALADGVVYDPQLAAVEVGSGSFSVRLSTGRDLPGWLEFDAATATFSRSEVEPDADESIARVEVVFTPDDPAQETFAIEVRIDPADSDIDPAINALFDRDPYFAAQGLFEFEVASDLAVEGAKANQVVLPDWLEFDAATLSFTGTPPEEYVGILPVRIDVPADPDAGIPEFAIIRDIVIDESYGLSSQAGFGVTVFDELIDLSTPEDFFGSFAIEYNARDTKGAVSEDPAIIIINVAPQRELPDALADQFDVDEDSFVVISLADILANDSDDDGDPIRVIAVSDPDNASISVVVPQVSADYPQPGEVGVDAVFTAALANGDPLPAWLTVDSDTGQLSGTPPLSFKQVLEVVVSHDNGTISGNETVTLDVDGNDGATLVFTPDQEFSGEITFNYTLTDDSEGEVQGTVRVDVIPANDPPVAEDDVVDGVEDTVLRIDPATLLANDTDVDGDVLSIVSVSNAVNGTVELVDGEIVFTPTDNFDGAASFEYEVSDGTDGSDTGKVTVNVASTNRAPVTGIDRYDGTEDTAFNLRPEELLDNDSDPDGDTIQFVSFNPEGFDLSSPTEDGFQTAGNVTERPDGSFDFTPRENFNGEVSFTYTITDGRLNSVETFNLVIDFAAVNDDPTVLGEGGFSTNEDQAISFNVADLLANDSDVDGDTLSITGVNQFVNGTAVLDNGVITFTPLADYHGNGGFSYVVSDGNGGEAIGAVTLNIVSVEDAPIAVADGIFGLDEDSFIDIAIADLLANDSDPDGDPISFAGVSGAGAEVLDSDTVRFRPAADQNGQMTFTYSITDGNGPAVSTTVTLNVRPIDDDPDAGDDTVNGTEDQVLVIPIADLITNDGDVDGHAISVTAVQNAIGGSVALDGEGNIVFTPDANRDVAGSFEYVLEDSSGAVDTATVTVNLEAVNDAPEIGAIAPITVAEDEPVNVQLPDVFTDPEGDPVTLSLTLSKGDPLPAWLSFDGDIRTLTGTPPANFNGDLDRTVSASDGDLTSQKDVSFTITAVNDAPIVTIPLADQSSDEDTAVSFTLPAGSFSDVDGDALTLSATLSDGSALPAWLVFDADAGSFAGTPPQDFNGSLDVTVTASDGTHSASDTFTLSIDAVNDAPIVATPLADQSSPEDTAVSFTLPAGSFSDVDGDALTLSATLSDGSALPAWLVFDADAGSFAGTPPQDFNGSLDVTVTASDGTHSASDTFTLSIDAVNDAPIVATPLADQSSPEDTAVSFTLPAGSFSDVDGDVLTLSATLSDGSALPAWLVFDADAGSFSGTPPQDFNGSLDVTVTASDGALSASDTFTLSIDAVNDAPIVATPLADQSSDEDTAVSFTLPAGSFSDVDGDALTLSATLSDGSALPAWLMFDADAGSFDGTPPQDFNGSLDVTVTASDGSLSASDTFSLSIDAVNDAPEAADDTVAGIEDQELVIPVLQLLDNDTDRDGDTLTISSVANGEGYTAELDGVGNIVVTFEENRNGPVTLDYTVTDGTLSDVGQVTINIAPQNDAPVIQAIANVRSDEDVPVDFALPDDLASDVDGDALTYSATRASGAALPDWLSFDAAARRFTGTPPANFFGTISLALIVSDGELQASSNFDLIIDPINDAPILSGPYSDRFTPEDQPFDIALQSGLASDPDGDPLTFDVTAADGSPLPAWLNFDAARFALTGTPPENFFGDVDLRITISDGQAQIFDEFTFTVTGVNDAPYVANPLPDLPVDPDNPEDGIFVGEAFSIDIPANTFEDVDGDALQFAALLADGSALPDWLTFDGSTLSGTTPSGGAGDYNIEILATDGELQASDTFFFTVQDSANTAPVAGDDGVFDTRGEIPIRISPDRLLANDYDPDGDDLQIVSLTDGQNGTVSVNNNGVVVYRADAGFVGDDQFNYFITDGTAVSEATVSVRVDEPFDNVENGGSGDDVLIGDFRSDNYLNGGRGDDFLISGRGDDTLIGGAGNDFLISGRGNDTIRGGRGDDIAFAGAGADEIFGGAGDDLIFGGNGRDHIVGGRGDDLLFGGRGSDTFVFREGDGADTIVGYQPSRAGRRFTIEGDKINLSVDGISNFDDLLVVGQNQGGGVLFDFGNGDEIFLSGTRLSALDRDDFTFF